MWDYSDDAESIHQCKTIYMIVSPSLSDYMFRWPLPPRVEYLIVSTCHRPTLTCAGFSTTGLTICCFWPANTYCKWFQRKTIPFHNSKQITEIYYFHCKNALVRKSNVNWLLTHIQYPITKVEEIKWERYSQIMKFRKNLINSYHPWVILFPKTML